MILNDDDILKLAKLSKLKINDEEKKSFLEDLNNIFNMIKTMQQLDTNNIEPLSHPHNLFQRLREDIAVKIENKDEYQKNSPMIKEGFYIVPKIIE